MADSKQPIQIGRYVLHGEIASGGMAAVHYGRLVGPQGFAKVVAIKRLHRSLAHNESFKNMIVEEGRLAARVRHPNVVPPLDVLAEGGELLLVMEYVHGESLSRLMRRAAGGGETIPLAVGAAIMSNVLHGLHAAHEAKDETGKPLDIVHRDISPQNVIVGIDGVARVIDFGIAKAVTTEGNTTAGMIKGKVPYLSPEQLEGDPATRRTDLYAASVVFWEVLAGRRLFEGADDGEVLRNIMSMTVPPPSNYNTSVPRAVDDVVLRGLARRPEDRFPTTRDMAVALEDAVHLATATVVGAWAERLAVDALAERTKQLAEVEGADSTPGKKPEPAVGEETVAPSKVKGTQRLGHPPPLPAAPAKKTSVPPPPPPKRASMPSAPLIAVPPARPAIEPVAPSVPPPPVAAPPPPTMAMPVPSPAPEVAPTARPSRVPRAKGDLGHSIASAPHAPKPSTAQPVEVRTIIYEPPPMPEADFVAGVRPLSQNPSSPALEKAPVPAPSVPVVDPSSPVVAPGRGSQVDWIKEQRPPPAPRRSRLKVFFGYLVGFIVFALILAWFFAPALVRAWIVTSAADRGIVVTIERVDVSRKQVHLLDVKAESKDLPGVALRAGTLDINLRWLRPDKVVFDDAELTLDGSFTEIGTRLDKYKLAQQVKIDQAVGGLREIEVISGRVDWRSILGPGTSALVENVAVDIVRKGNRPIGDDYKISAPLFGMRLGEAPVGPWIVEVDRQGIVQRTILRFDPSGMYPGIVTRTASDDGSLALTFAIPPTRLLDLRFPASVIGGSVAPQSRLEARGELQIVKGDKSRDVLSHLVFGLANVNVFPNGPPVDLSLDFPPTGDVSKPIPLSATLALAPDDPNGGGTTAVTSAPLTGTFDLTGRAAKIELSGKTPPIACAPPAGPKAAPAIPLPKGASLSATGLATSIVLSFENMSTSKLSFTPAGTCVPKLK